MRYAIISKDGASVVNVIVATPETIAELGLNAVLLADKTLCGPGDSVIDLKGLVFAPPPDDPTVLQAAKDAASAKIDAAASRLQAISDGTLKQQLQDAQSIDDISKLLSTSETAIEAVVPVPVIPAPIMADGPAVLQWADKSK